MISYKFLQSVRLWTISGMNGEPFTETGVGGDDSKVVTGHSKNRPVRAHRNGPNNT